MKFHVVTLFPTAFDSYLNESIIARAIKDKKIKVNFYNPRDFSKDKWKRIDQKPYSGGPGMVIQAEPVIRAIEQALQHAHGTSRKKKNFKIIFLTPGGKQFDTAYAKKLANPKILLGQEKLTDIVLVCGRYEGIDARVRKIFKMEEISIGPFVLTGGELPAMVLIDCISRQIEGVLGSFDSLEESRVSSHDVYTRPEVFEYRRKKYRVPKVLLSGHHQKIEEWKTKSKTKI